MKETEQSMNAAEYALRDGLESIGWKGLVSEGTMFAWAPLPEGYTNSNDFVLELIDKAVYSVFRAVFSEVLVKAMFV